MSRRKRNRIPQEPIEAEIIGLNHQGQGIAKIDGKTMFVSNALPGETATIKYRAVFSQYDDGEAIDIKNPSADRVEPQCPHYSQCGGCGLQHLAADKQRLHKQNTLLELIEHQTQKKPKKILEPLTSEPFGYRRKARISIKNVPGKGDVLVGFREKYSSYVTVMNQCEVLHPVIGQKIQAFRELFSQFDMKQAIPQMEIAITDAKNTVILRHMAPLTDHDKNLLIDFAKDNDLHILLQPKGIKTIHSFYPEQEPTLQHYKLDDENLIFYFEPWQFTQVNQQINQKMIAQAIQLLDLQSTDTVLDLYCGIGNFSLPIAKRAKTVIGVEGEKASVDMASYNADKNQLANTAFHTFDLRDDPSEQDWAQQQYDKILLDPARSGAKEILPWIEKWQPKKIVYVSCNPSTLARDCEILCHLGYNMSAAGMMDMFPQTEHTEAMVLFDRVD